MEIIKIITDFLFNYLSFTRLTTIIVSFLIVFFLELKLLSMVDNIIIGYLIRVMMIIVLYYGCYLMKFDLEIKINLILTYIVFTATLIISNYTEPIEKENLIQQKQLSQTEEQKHKYNYGTIEEKILILKDMNLSKEQIYKKLENNTDFRILIKDNQNKFDEIFQKKN